jgi:hypothetical protein
MKWSMCCENPDVKFVREEPRSGGGKREFYTCVNCHREHSRILDNEDKPEHQRSDVDPSLQNY